MKVFLGFHDITGYYSSLKKGFDQLGVDSVFANAGANVFKYGEHSDHAPFWVRIVSVLASRFGAVPREKQWLRLWWYGWLTLAKSQLFVWALLTYDVFIFGYATSFFALYDLPILRFFSKKIIFVFHGSDARPPYINGAIMSPSRNVSVQQCIELTRRRKRIIRRIERYADVVVSQPLYGHFHEKPFVNFSRIGLPFQFQDYQPIGHSKTQLKIVHAPSHPEAKGTARIRQAIEVLRQKGYDFEYVEITNKPNNEVIEALMDCDFVVDQLYTDVPMAGFATEAAFLGKPSIVGSYNLQELERFFPEEVLSISHFCHPDEVEVAVEKLIVDDNYRLELGKKAQAYAVSHWQPVHVATAYMNIIQGHVDPELICDPQAIRNVHGAVIAEDRAREIIRDVVETGGIEALQLTDKPALQQRMVDFAFGTVDD